MSNETQATEKSDGAAEAKPKASSKTKEQATKSNVPTKDEARQAVRIALKPVREHYTRYQAAWKACDFKQARKHLQAYIDGLVGPVLQKLDHAIEHYPDPPHVERQKRKEAQAKAAAEKKAKPKAKAKSKSRTPAKSKSATNGKAKAAPKRKPKAKTETAAKAEATQ